MGKERRKVETKYRLVSFFSGIGGFDLGFERAGFEIVYQCEINDFCNRILEQHWPDVPRSKDIRRVNHEEIPDADVWAAGFPCQDVSLARMGPRSGLRGKQSGLFYDFARVIGDALPGVVLIENVAGLLSSHGGRDFQVVIRTLAELGYAVGWRVFNSKNFGVAQSRQRVYIVGCHRDWRTAAEILFEPQRGKRNADSRGQNGQESVSPFKKSFGDPVRGPVVQGLAYCFYACSARHTGTDWSRTYVTYPEGRVRRLTPREGEAIQGFPVNWTLPKDAIEDSEDLDALRYHAVGNAVTVNVAEWLAQRIADALAQSSAEPAAARLPDSDGVLQGTAR
ncbi:MAG: DNA (cytosine-5-)-methyltransferase [Candidatus Tectomicrobia bacterium]|nr:DNA (cytosine-5-)-methyltransferase [Candidatus Tectomicrobia bacterium]